MTSGQAKRMIACLLLYAFSAVPALADRSHGFGGGSASFGGRPRAVENGGRNADPLLNFLHQFCEPLFASRQKAVTLSPRMAGFGALPAAGTRADELEIALGIKSEQAERRAHFAAMCAGSISPVNYDRALEISGNHVRSERSLPINNAWQAISSAIQRRMNGGGSQSADEL